MADPAVTCPTLMSAPAGSNHNAHAPAASAQLTLSERAANGYRVYDERAVPRVRNIRYLLAAGVTVEDVRVFAPCLDGDVAAGPPSGRGVQVAVDRLAVLNQRIAVQTEVRDRLEAALRQHVGA